MSQLQEVRSCSTQNARRTGIRKDSDVREKTTLPEEFHEILQVVVEDEELPHRLPESNERIEEARGARTVAQDIKGQTRSSPPPAAVPSFQYTVEVQVGDHVNPSGEERASYDLRNIRLSGKPRVFDDNLNDDKAFVPNQQSQRFFTGLSCDAGISSQNGTRYAQQAFLGERERSGKSRGAGRSLQYTEAYKPYSVVKDRRLKQHLVVLARRLQFLDRGFAEYFREVMSLSHLEQVRQKVLAAHQVIAHRRGSRPLSCDPSDVECGDLGRFCWRAVESSGKPKAREISYSITYAKPDDFMHYLQDAFEVPYWDLMLSFILRQRANSTDLMGDIVLRVLSSVKMSVLNDRRRVLCLLATLAPEDQDSLKPILDGIEARIAILEDAYDPEIENGDNMLFATPASEGIQSRSDQGKLPNKEPPESKRTVVLISLVLACLAGAIVPGYKGFALSMQSHERGTTHDPDFWYLIQNSIMAVLGSLVMATQLMENSWMSPAYTMMWTFSGLGLACASISIAIYPLCNTGWSSMLSFFGSIMSQAAVLVMTQATTRPIEQNGTDEVSPEKKTQ